VHEVFTALGLTRSGRHWRLDDLFVEVPGNRLYEQAEEFDVGPMTLRVVRKEYVLADRIVGYRHWKYWAYGSQSIEMIRAFQNRLDEPLLRAYLRGEGSEHAYDLLRAASDGTGEISESALEALWHEHYS
jgi:hypothetical protein